MKDVKPYERNEVELPKKKWFKIKAECEWLVLAENEDEAYNMTMEIEPDAVDYTDCHEADF